MAHVPYQLEKRRIVKSSFVRNGNGQDLDEMSTQTLYLRYIMRVVKRSRRVELHKHNIGKK